MRRIYRNNREKLLLIITAVIVFAYLLKPGLFDYAGFAPFGAAALIVGYFSGALALVIGLFYTLLTFLSTLPVIATVYAFIAYSIARIHYSIMRWLTLKVVRRVRGYQELKIKVKSTRAYIALKKIFNTVLRRSGITEPHPLKIFKIKKCVHCVKDIPLEGRYCPYCGKEGL